MRTTRDQLEARLTSLFRAQAEAIPVRPADGIELRPVAASKRTSAPRVLLAAAAAVAAIVAVVATSGGDDPARLHTGPADDAETAAPTTTTPAPSGFHVETRQVSLTADAVAIDAAGKRFVTAPPIQVHGDPGVPGEYTTLELTWTEHDVEMRLFVYFRSDGREWWSDEIRTYDGRSPGEWITYTGEFFRRPLGSPFQGDFDVSGVDPETERLRISNARLEAFRRSPSCDAATGPLALDPGTSPIVIEGAPSGYGVNVHLLDAASCSVLADQDRYRYAWESRDSTVVAVDTRVRSGEPGSRHADLRSERPGRTSVHVTATDPDSGATVAEADVPVVVVVATAPPTTVAPSAAPGAAPGPVL